MEKYIIIGNGTAAAACIEGIRSVDLESEITVISAEEHPVYCRPLISYYLEGKTDRSRMNYRNADFYEANNCKVLYGRCAEKIDKEKKCVTLDGGDTLAYTKLCVATGSSPFVPPFEGLDTVPFKCSFMTLDDAEKLKSAVAPHKKVLIIGAGLIGLKCAEGIRDLVESITVCDLADRVLSSILDAQSAEMVQKHLEKNGINFLLSDSAKSFKGNTAYMNSGKEIDFDILVLAIGVRANTGLVRDLGGEVNRGIIVDEHMRTNIDGIYSAGDCAEGDDITFGAKRVLALLPNAYFQGYTAGVNMAGGEKTLDNAIPMNSIGFFGLHMMTAGTPYSEEQGGETYVEVTDDKIKKLFIKDGVMTGFVLVGECERTGLYTAMIRDRVPIDSVDFELMKKIPTSMAYSQEKRSKMFGGVV